MWQERASLRTLAGLLLAFFALSCGDERPPWSGFEVFPPDASLPPLSPELEARLQAAAAAFVAPPDAGSAQAASTTSPVIVDAGVEPPPRMAAESERRPDDNEEGAKALPAAPDAGTQKDMPRTPPPRWPAAGARSFPPRWPFGVDAAVGVGRADERADDAGATEPAADGGG